MAYVKIMIHVVWGTKNRYPYLTKEIRNNVIEHIKSNAFSKGIYIDSINGHLDHIHCLLGLNADMSIGKAVNLLKGESSFWINKQKLTPTKFEWADEYFAVSISESILDKVRKYIENQEEHHKKKSFADEYDDFIRKYNFVFQG